MPKAMGSGSEIWAQTCAWAWAWSRLVSCMRIEKAAKKYFMAPAVT